MRQFGEKKTSRKFRSKFNAGNQSWNTNIESIQTNGIKFKRKFKNKGKDMGIG